MLHEKNHLKMGKQTGHQGKSGSLNSVVKNTIGREQKKVQTVEINKHINSKEEKELHCMKSVARIRSFSGKKKQKTKKHQSESKR